MKIKSYKFSAVMCIFFMLAAGGLLFCACGPSAAGRIADRTPPQPAVASASPDCTASFAGPYTPQQTVMPAFPSAAAVDDKDAIAYFQEVTLKSEFGGAESENIIKRWESPVAFYLAPGYTPEDERVIREHAAYLGTVPGMPELRFVGNEFEANFCIYFVTQDEMNDYTKEYDEIAWGFVRVWWESGTYRLNYAEARIVTDTQTQLQRTHALLEEITQGLGLLNDSRLYPDSIFQTDYYEGVTQLSEMDKKVIAYLYDPLLHAGMDGETAVSILRAQYLR